MANVIINDTHLNNIADSIRNKNGTNTKYKPSEMATAISNIPVGEDVTIEVTQQNDLIVAQSVTIDDIKLALQNKSAGGGEEIVLQEKTITPTKSSQTITPDENYDGLSKVTVNPIGEEYVIPTGTLEITSNGTHNVTNYASASVNVPSEDLTSELNTYEDYLTTQETTIDDIALALQNKIASSRIDMEALITRTITSYSSDTLTKVGEYVFYNCTLLENLNLPNVTTCGAYSFYKLGVTELHLPELTNSSTCTFAGMGKLKTLILPKVATLGNSSVKDCNYLTFTDLGVCTKIDLLSFNNCSRLATLIIRTGSVCQLANISALNNTQISKGTGYVYVPDELVEEYKIATNWSNFANQIKPLSELEG